jgi:PKD repeat protein
MKAQLRSVLVGGVSLAVAIAGSPLGSPRVAAAAAPQILSATFDPATPKEGQVVTLSLTLAVDPDNPPVVTVSWGVGSQETKSLTLGQTTVSFQNVYWDEARTAAGYTVQVDVDDFVNTTVTQTYQLVVANVAPTVSLTASATALLPHQTLTVSGSFSDPSRLDTFSLTLDWGDGSPAWTQSYSATAARTFAPPAHEYAAAGAFTVRVTVTDDDGGVGTATASLVVNTPPSNLALSATTAVEGDPTTLSGSFSDPDLTDSHTVAIVWGDGQSSSVTLAAHVLVFSVDHVYVAHGAYSASVTVSDPAGASVSGPAGITVLVRNQPPADVKLAIGASVEGTAASLSGSFTDADAADTHTVVVDWGDGTQSTTVALGAGVLSFSADHVYATAGTYNVSVTVTDSANASTSGTTQATVSPANHAPANLALSGADTILGQGATLTGTFTDADATDTHTVVVSWGDGTQTTLSLVAGAMSFSATHTYATAGTYTVSATVTDAAGASVSGTTMLTVRRVTLTELLAQLVVLIRSWNLDSGNENSLVVKVQPSCDSLNALVNAAAAQTGKRLTADQLTTLGALVAQAQTALGCPSSSTARPTTAASQPAAFWAEHTVFRTPR